MLPLNSELFPIKDNSAEKDDKPEDQEKEVYWDKTIRSKERMKNNPFYEEPDKDSPNGYYQGRPIIGRDTKVKGGVYLGGGEREAIVVDEKYKRLNEIYQELVLRLKEKEKHGEDLKENILSEVFKIVKEKLPYDEEVVLGLEKKLNLGTDKKIALDYYIEEGGGVCRHQVLLGAYLLEKLKKEGYVRGTASVDRNAIKGKGGHAWIRYTNSKGRIFIIDPAQNYLGGLEDIRSSDRWFYERPEDKNE